MPSTTAEATREELIAEYVIRDAVFYVQNRILSLLEHDRDIYDRLPGLNDEVLVEDERRHDLFNLLWPDDAEPDLGVHAEASYLGARMLRTIVYHSEQLRGEADDLFRHSASQAREAKVNA